MKKILIILSIMFCTTVFAHTIEWYVDDKLLSTTTCESGDSITPPTAPAKFGYTFKRWQLEYTPIEYLESTGTQWIDTGVAFTNDNNKLYYSFKISVQHNVVSNGEANFMSSEKSGYGFNIGFKADDSFCVFCAPTQPPASVTINDDVVIGTGYFSSAECYSDLLEKSISGRPQTSQNIQLFRLANSDLARRYYSGRMYFLRLFLDDTLVRDFIPALDKNGIPCLYDRVEKKFYYNAGTGQFIAGPIVDSGE